MRSPQDIQEAVGPKLRLAGQRLTPRRRRLVQILVDAEHPMTIPEILRSGKGLAASSVYRNLAVLEQAGLVRRIVTQEDEFARFELAEELTEHHHHFVCSSCGLVRDVPTDPQTEKLLRKLSANLSEGTFTPTGHRVDVVGLCSDCS